MLVSDIRKLLIDFDGDVDLPILGVIESGRGVVGDSNCDMYLENNDGVLSLVISGSKDSDTGFED